METLEEYLHRKQRELELLAGCLNTRLSLERPTSPAEVMKQKFQIASALKAEYAIQDWALTETAWAHHGRMSAGPFEFSYDYQRADLAVRGPSFYAFDDPKLHDTVYTSSGMSAISALLLASAKLRSSADIIVAPGSYGETLELIETHARHLQMIQLNNTFDLADTIDRPRMLLLDSCGSAKAFESILRCKMPQLDLVVFDTTCFSSGSRRIGRVLDWARRRNLPIVLVRSHTKLDSLGLEYGRLGSAVFIDARARAITPHSDFLDALASETRKAIRLFGGAALPAHFPPYVGTPAYRVLTDTRIARILLNSRRTARYFASMLPDSLAPTHFAHGLYLTLQPKQSVDESQARRLAADLSADLSEVGLLLRHAGSFGFDFGAAEWFHDTTTSRYLVRIAVPDLPTLLWDQIGEAIAEWWSANA